MQTQDDTNVMYTTYSTTGNANDIDFNKIFQEAFKNTGNNQNNPNTFSFVQPAEVTTTTYTTINQQPASFTSTSSKIPPGSEIPANNLSGSVVVNRQQRHFDFAKTDSEGNTYIIDRNDFLFMWLMLFVGLLFLPPFAIIPLIFACRVKKTKVTFKDRQNILEIHQYSTLCRCFMDHKTEIPYNDVIDFEVNADLNMSINRQAAAQASVVSRSNAPIRITPPEMSYITMEKAKFLKQTLAKRINQ
jgi:hypothetical protein